VSGHRRGHLTLERLRAYLALSAKAAPGVGGLTLEAYAGAGAKPPRPARRATQGRVPGEAVVQVVHPQGGHRRRPLGIVALEDKIAQRAVVQVLSAATRRTFHGSPCQPSFCRTVPPLSQHRAIRRSCRAAGRPGSARRKQGEPGMSNNAESGRIITELRPGRSAHDWAPSGTGGGCQRRRVRIRSV
jgi:hypothetical protein